MHEFVLLKNFNKTDNRMNVYLSDGFTPKYTFSNIAERRVIERDTVIMPKRDLRENDKR